MKTKFKPGDIIEGFEGGEGWGNLATLLLIHVYEDDCYALIIKNFDTVKKTLVTPYNRYSKWCLSFRDWKKMGELPNIRKASETIARVIENEYGVCE